MPNDLEAALGRVIKTIAQHNSIRAIGMSGGERPLPEPGEGDIDLFVYCTEIPTKEERQELLTSIRQEVEPFEVGKLASGHWGQGDCLTVAGVETWLLYFTVAEARAELEAILTGNYPGRLDSYYYPVGRCAMWKTMRAFHDPDGILQGFKECVAEYPETLRTALIRHHLSALDDVEDLERAVGRRDVFFFHFALDLALDHFLQAVFALNREYFPSRKRSETYLRSFKVKPVDCEQRLRQVVLFGGNAETLEQAYEIWKGLIQDLRLLETKV
ncbi:MAG TPA: DUF4037 domain-containing protein [Anaerolineales bacterium]|nr:DUF4037 domain-containing protein [Anaerolineales bacterium]